MSRSRRLFSKIQKSMPDLVLCKDMLVIPPTEHVVRGFLLEATSERERVYLWKVATPLLRPIRRVILNYSDRISGGEPNLYIRKDAFEESAENIRDIISEEVEYLRGIRHPHDFLRHARWVVEGSPLLERFDQALMRYLVGDAQQSVRAFRALDREADQLDDGRREYIGPLLKRIVLEIDKDPAGLAALLGEWEQQNVERLGLEPSRLLSKRP
jgi:hypothetical protein